jgi:hypothetical protein
MRPLRSTRSEEIIAIFATASRCTHAITYHAYIGDRLNMDKCKQYGTNLTSFTEILSNANNYAITVSD